jgi:hypothetical protein
VSFLELRRSTTALTAIRLTASSGTMIASTNQVTGLWPYQRLAHPPEFLSANSMSKPPMITCTVNTIGARGLMVISTPTPIPGTARHSVAAVPPAFREEVMTGRRLHHPGRDYILFSGPLEAAMDLGHWPSQDWFVPQSPSLIWPTDNSWCIATEVDFDSTLIAGDNHLIDAVLGAENLEATPIEPADCLDSSGDTVNV